MGRVYDSIPERIRASELQLLLEQGEIVAWFAQIPIQLGLDAKHKLDFLVVGREKVWIEEVKAVDSKDWRRIRRLWAKYGPLPMAVFWAKKGGASWEVENVPPGTDVTRPLPEHGGPTLWQEHGATSSLERAC
jgi:hypothetical protein